ncbi:MAG: hypothetical protein E7090_08170 [Bacteroidales bacterium]|nr:hypothetical protein [Bacteroidales bacterium]
MTNTHSTRFCYFYFFLSTFCFLLSAFCFLLFSFYFLLFLLLPLPRHRLRRCHSLSGEGEFYKCLVGGMQNN